MPTYEYKCRKCDHQFERFQSITAEPVKTCPKCKGKVARMLTTGAGIIFKGTGFYQTDYKKSSHRAPPSEQSGAKKVDVAKTDGGKSENSKPEKSAK